MKKGWKGLKRGTVGLRASGRWTRYRRVESFLARETLIPSSSKTFVEGEKEEREKRKEAMKRKVGQIEMGTYEVTSPQIPLLFFYGWSTRKG
jgi:hypothetical protein